MCRWRLLFVSPATVHGDVSTGPVDAGRPRDGESVVLCISVGKSYDRCLVLRRARREAMMVV